MCRLQRSEQSYRRRLLSDDKMQINLKKKSKCSAFVVPVSEFYQFKRMPFGLKGSPKTFTRLIDLLFGPEFDYSVFFYMGEKLVERILKRLLEAGLKVNREKCEFSCSSVNYLGYSLDKDELSTDPERVKAVPEIPSKEIVKELRTVLGMFGWYSRFIENEAERKILLVRLLRKKTTWK